MRWSEVKKLKDKEFQRWLGIKRILFDKMVIILKEHLEKSEHKVKGKRRGPKRKWIVEEQLLVLLRYYREYTSIFSISKDYGMSETQAWRYIQEIEKILIKHGEYQLLGKKYLLLEKNVSSVIIDVGEQEIERPKKNKKNIIQGRKNVTQSKLN